MLSGSKSFVFEFACWCHEVFIIVVDIGQWHAPNNKRTKTMEIAVWFCICADKGGGSERTQERELAAGLRGRRDKDKDAPFGEHHTPPHPAVAIAVVRRLENIGTHRERQTAFNQMILIGDSPRDTERDGVFFYRRCLWGILLL